MTSKLTNPVDLYAVLPRQEILPLTYAIQEGKSLILGAMARVDLVDGNTTLMTAFLSRQVTVSVCRTVKAPDLLARKACTHLYPPNNPDDFNRLQPFVRHRCVCECKCAFVWKISALLQS